MSQDTRTSPNRPAGWLLALAVVATLVAIGVAIMAFRGQETAQATVDAASTRVAEAEEAESSAQQQGDTAGTQSAQAAADSATAQAAVADAVATADAARDAEMTSVAEVANAEATANEIPATLTQAAALADEQQTLANAAATGAANAEATATEFPPTLTRIASLADEQRAQASAAGTEVANAVATATRIPPTLTQAAALVDEQQTLANAAATQAATAATAIAQAAATVEGVPPTLTQVAQAQAKAAAEVTLGERLVSIGVIADTDPQAALRELTALSVNYPDRREILSSRAAVYTSLEQYDDALADYTRLVELFPEDARAYRDRAEVYRTQEQYADALTDYNLAIDLLPDDPTLYYSRGLVFQDLNRFNRALDDYSRALELQPDFVEGYLTRGRLYRDLLRYDEALADFETVIDTNPDALTAYLERATVYLQQDDTAAALADYNRVLDLDPANATAYQERGDLYYQLEDFQAANADYNAYASVTGSLEPYMADRLAAIEASIPYTLDAPGLDNLAVRTSGDIPHDQDDNFIETYDPGVFLADFVVSATFINPYAPSVRDWDYGFFFRTTDTDNFQIVTYSTGDWQLYYQSDEFVLIQEGRLENFDTGEGGSNRLRLEAQGERGVFYVNNDFVANLDLSRSGVPGTILLGTGFLADSEINGEVTPFDSLAIQAIGDFATETPPSAPTATATPMPGTADEDAGEAEIGTNTGEIVAGGAQVWTYTGTEGELLTIRTDADWDTTLGLYLDDEEIAFNDDATFLFNFNSEIVVTLPADGTYIIVVAGYDENEWGPYTLTVEPGLAKDPVTPTPTPES